MFNLRPAPVACLATHLLPSTFICPRAVSSTLNETLCFAFGNSRVAEIGDIGLHQCLIMDEKMIRRRIDGLFGDRRHKFLVVCDEGVFLHTDRPDYSNHHDESHKVSGDQQSVGLVSKSKLTTEIHFWLSNMQ
ncbi:hypothetical protein AVEN_67502-1 [Araneus ventricosus]|uniref:Uncharacterized protein n=1 Tax=Araneus ventricosus TaxID=182803 RepID=A0A4Y2P0C1_ARAVE|nr:hypothetical protein AVEN_67502-1 [Araneus ventricosus]